MLRCCKTQRDHLEGIMQALKELNPTLSVTSGCLFKTAKKGKASPLLEFRAGMNWQSQPEPSHHGSLSV